VAGAALDTKKPAKKQPTRIKTPQDIARIREAGFWALIGRHRTFTTIFVVGALLRIVTMIGYRPAMWFNDSFDYLHVAMSPYPHPIRPDGYAFFLLALRPFHSFALVVGLQHLMGLAMAAMIYALLRVRFGLPKWGATLAAAPVLLDAYQIQLEHLILSDVPFTFMVIAVVVALMWYAKPSWKVGAVIGLTLGLATLTRSVGLPVLLAVVVFMLTRRARCPWPPIRCGSTTTTASSP
jgi:Dolichyl-phosphate-mannose-protein mannosyltransferase